MSMMISAVFSGRRLPFHGHAYGRETICRNSAINPPCGKFLQSRDRKGAVGMEPHTPLPYGRRSEVQPGRDNHATFHLLSSRKNVGWIQAIASNKSEER